MKTAHHLCRQHGNGACRDAAALLQLIRGPTFSLKRPSSTAALLHFH
jgi:hypothetical protein